MSRESLESLLAEWQERRDGGDAEEASRLLREHPELGDHVALAGLLARRPDREAPREIGRGGMGVVYR